ncbi:MAG: peptidoglycan-binding protein [Clostridia bacterium]|nr:peptidoglycan-binding protein [Clostridia bacterium]
MRKTIALLIAAALLAVLTGCALAEEMNPYANIAPYMPQANCAHVWGDWAIVRPSTCYETGLYARTCTLCGMTQSQEIPRMEHAFGDWIVSRAATCAAAGEQYRVCKLCGYREAQAIDALPHSFGRWTERQEASCTQPGIRSRQCYDCGYVETVQTDPVAHTYGSWKLISEPSCVATGERVRWCVICGAREAQTLNMLPHEYGGWAVTVPTSCTAPGQRARTCVICGTSQTEVIDQLAHEYGAWSVSRQPTCTLKGVETRVCLMCGGEQHRDIAMLPHQYEWEITTQATDHSAGLRTRRCTVCGGIDRQESFDPDGTLRKGARGAEVRALQQLLADQGYLAPGGVDGSYGGGTERALIQFQKDQGLTADGVAWPQTRQRLNHVYGDWQLSVPLTRDADGEYHRTCQDCGYREYATVKANAAILRPQRGEEVRAIQRMLNDLGYNAGTADGAYGPKLDAAFEAFAAENNAGFTPGQLLPSNVDALVNAWIVDVPASKWMGQGTRDAAVRLILTVTERTGEDADLPDILTYDWKLTNMGSENCRIDAVLLGFGDNCDFTSDSLAVAIDGSLLNRNGNGSASGSFSVAADWGEGNLNFCALATSEKTGAVWQSNTKVFAR